MMKHVKSTVKINRHAIKHITQAAAEALVETAAVLQDEIVRAAVVPRDTGALEDEKFFIDTSEVDNGRVALMHEGPYARRLYYHPELKFDKTENSNAQGEWFKPWVDGDEKDRVRELFAEKLKEEL